MNRRICFLVAALFITSDAIRIPIPEPPIVPKPPAAPESPNLPKVPTGPDGPTVPGFPDSPTNPSFPDRDRPATPNTPNTKNDPVRWPEAITEVIGNIPLPSQDDIELDLGLLESNIAPQNNFTTVNVTVLEIVSAILDGPQCFRANGSSLTVGLGGATETPCPTSVFTPTTTLASSSFRGCQVFAQILSSCASVTPTFYSRAPSVQASCICYPKTTPTIDCRSTTSIVQTATAKLEPSRFDDQVKQCHDYLDIQGYKGLAKGLLGSQGNMTGIGVGFCEDVDKEIKSKGNSSVGLLPELTSVWMNVCPKPPHQGAADTLKLGPRMLNLFLLSSLAITASIIIFA